MEPDRLDRAFWHAALTVTFPAAGRVVRVSVSSVGSDGEPSFSVHWSSRPDRLTVADISTFEAQRRGAIATLRRRLAAMERRV